MKQLLSALCTCGLVLLFFTGAAFSHAVILWAYFEDGQVHVEAFTQKGTQIKNAQLVIVNKGGKTLLEGKTDDEGKFAFVPPQKDEMTIVMVIDDAHKTEFKLLPEDFVEQ